MKNSKKNIYKISMLAFFFLLIASGFSSKSIFDFGKFNESSVFNKTPESGFINKENDNSLDDELFVQLPSSGFINTFFTVAVSGDTSNPLINSYVTISGGPHMQGNTILNNVNGTAYFNDIYFDAAGTYRIDASAGALTGHGQIVIYPTLDPSKLVITNITACDSTGIMVNSLFSVTVQAQDINNFPANVNILGGLDVSLTLIPPVPGGLSGNMSGNMGYQTNTLTISGVKITQIQTLVKIKASGGTLTPGLSSEKNVIAGPHHIGFVNLPPSGFVNFPLQTFQVAYYNSDNTPANCYDGIITLTQITPQPPPTFLTGTTQVTSNNGRATFSAVYFTSPGIYTIKATSPGLPEPYVISGPISIAPGDPEITSTILPLNMQGNSVNAGHTPFVFLAKISFLNPNFTYRYYNRVVHTVNTETGEGWGNVIFANPSGNFTRTSNPNFNTAGDYGEFTTDAYGSYTGWFISEATGDAVFTTPGDSVKMRISIRDPNTTAFMLTTAENVRIRDYNTPPLEVSKRCNFLDQVSDGTGTPLLPKNFLLFYSQVDSSNLRPVSGTLIESDGLSLAGLPYYTNYISDVDGVNKRWGTIIPCDGPGITKIEERNLTGNKIGNSVTSLPGSIRSVAYSSTGVWVPGVDTKNPPGGNTVLSIQPMFINVGITQIGNQVPSEYKLSQNYPNPFNPVTKIKFEIPKSSFVNLAVYDILGREVAKLVNEKLNAGTYLVDWNASQYPSGVYFYRLQSGDFVDVKKMLMIK